MTDDVSDISDLPEEMQLHIMVDALYNERDRWQSDLDKHVMENNAMIVNNYISRYRTRRSRKSGLYIFVVVVFLVGLAFALGGFVHWPEAIVMAIAATIGGYAGAPIAKALPPSAVRLIVIAVGFGMSAIFFARQFL